MAPPKLHVFFCLFCCLPQVHPFHRQDPPPSPFDFRSPGKRRQTPSDFKMLHVLLCEKVLLRSVPWGLGRWPRLVIAVQAWGAEIGSQPWCKKFPVLWGDGQRWEKPTTYCQAIQDDWMSFRFSDRSCLKKAKMEADRKRHCSSTSGFYNHVYTYACAPEHACGHAHMHVNVFREIFILP